MKGATMREERKRGMREWFRAAGVAAAAFMTVCLLGLGGPAHAGELKVVRGVVGTVTGDMIFVGGKSIDLNAIEIHDTSGKKVAISEIKPGTTVGLYYRRGTLVSVLVYPAMME